MPPLQRLLSLALVLASACVPGATTSPPAVAVTEIFAAGEKNERGFSVFGYRIPGFVSANNGSTLVVLAEARKYSCSDEGAHDLVAKRSTDHGRSWSPVQTVVDPAAVWGPQEGGRKGGAVYDPTPVYDESTGKIHVIFSFCPSRYMSRPLISQAFQLWEVTSGDLGLHWSAPRNLSSLLPGDGEAAWCQRTGGGGGNGIQLAHGPKAGRLVVPGYHSFCKAPPPSPPDPSCSAAKAQKVADAWCNSPDGALGAGCNAKPGPLVARRSGSKGSQLPAWRCYSPSCLTPDQQRYRNGSGCIEYCTEVEALEHIMSSCAAPGGHVPGESMSHVLTSDGTDAQGQRAWQLGGSFLRGSGEGSVAEVGPNTPGELLFVARRTSATHCTGPAVAHCVGAIRSADSGDQWDSATARDVGALLDPACKNTVAAVGAPPPAAAGRPNLLVHAGTHSSSARTNVSAIFSRDGGISWLEEDAVMIWAAPLIGGYVAVQPLGPTQVGVVFENRTCSVAIGVFDAPLQ